MKRVLIYLIITLALSVPVMIVLSVPTMIALACSMETETDDHMVNQDTTIHNNMGHMDHQSDMAIHDPEEPVVSPEIDAAKEQPTTESGPADPQSTEKAVFQGHKGAKENFHTHSLP
jgi:hypothetical protein